MLKKFFAIIEETYREAIARKTIVGFFIFSTLIILIAFFVFQSSTVKDAMTKMKETNMSGGKPNMATDMIMVSVLDIFWTIVSAILYFMTVCVGIFATTGFITSQMEKGTIDLLLSKPVPRWLYIIGRYIGSLTIILLEVTWFVVGMWVVVSLSTGAWHVAFLSSIFFIMLGFAGIYSIVVLISVLSRSSALSIVIGIGLYFISGLISLGRGIEKVVSTDSKSTLSYIADVLYYVFPQTSDMSGNMKNAILGNPVEWMPVVLIVALTAVYVSVSVYAFNKKQF
ncbi:MAG: ABC transporter permease subunit [Bacteroidota bacterium]|nr:ABC transporter permease subunit [Bacteroidota bacterium]MDP4231659.1 ABC transporter permease subunit [Bacteroidota bacterium]MDP4236972.1 ABC transporter permease subunit [Bacteroidota bacterium]